MERAGLVGLPAGIRGWDWGQQDLAGVPRSAQTVSSIDPPGTVVDPSGAWESRPGEAWPHKLFVSAGHARVNRLKSQDARKTENRPISLPSLAARR